MTNDANRDPSDPFEQRVLDDIKRVGWSCPQIPSGKLGPGFTYSVGIQSTLDHPELIVFGLSNISHGLLSDLYQRIETGERFDQTHQLDGLLENYPVWIVPVHPSQHETYLGYAMWHRRYCGQIGTLQAMQIAWPDMNGRFSWDHDCEPSVSSSQPDLRLASTID